jgi:excisionase family DNA binding protein
MASKYADLPLTLTAQDVAKVLGLSINQTYRLFRSKDFPSLKVGAKYLIPKPRFLQWLGVDN